MSIGWMKEGMIGRPDVKWKIYMENLIKERELNEGNWENRKLWKERERSS